VSDEYELNDREDTEAVERSGVVDAESTPTVPHLVLDLEGDRQQFPAYPHANQFLLVKHADALGEGGFATVLATTKLVVGQVLRDQRGAVEAYLEDHGGDPDYTDKLYASLTACWAGETNLPLAPSSVSSEPTATD
jgi:hypothetical protein